MDISPETVGTLSLIMLAQAQEVFFLKATSGTKGQTPQGSKHTHSLHLETVKSKIAGETFKPFQCHYDLSLFLSCRYSDEEKRNPFFSP